MRLMYSASDSEPPTLGVLLDRGLEAVELGQQLRVFEAVRLPALNRHIDGHGALKFFAQDGVTDAQFVARVKHADDRRINHDVLGAEQA